MSTWNPTTLVRVDDEDDRDRASNGYSRYGAYLDDRPKEFRDPFAEDEVRPLEPAEFAAAAWRVATSPVMVPGYVRDRPDIERITVAASQETGNVLAYVHLPLHQSDLAARLPFCLDWQPVATMANDGDYQVVEEPREGRPAVLASTIVRIEVPAERLIPQHHTTGRELADEAKAAVKVLVEEINTQAGPLVAAVLREKAGVP